MREKWIGSLAALAIAACAASTAVKAEGPRETRRPEIKYADELEYKSVGPGGASMAAVWGEPEKGPHGAFVRFEPGFKAPLHHHSSDLRIVVIQGAYIIGGPGGEKRLGPGSYVLEPAGLAHTTTADPKEGCLFYEEGLGKFDLVNETERP